jgi:hypothetical protein
MKTSRRQLIREFRAFLEACRDGDRRWKSTLLENRQFDGLIEANGRLHAYELMWRFLDAAERREGRSAAAQSAHVDKAASSVRAEP